MWSSWLRDGRSLVTLLVYLVIFVDNILLSVIVPIMPNYLMQMWYPNLTLAYSRLAVEGEGGRATIEPPSTEELQSLCASPFLLSPSEVEVCHASAIQSNMIYMGAMLLCKPALQLIANPVVGIVATHIGYRIPISTGLVILITSTLVFALGTSYPLLMAARAMQGVGSAASSAAGMAMIAEIYTEDGERSTAMSLALGSLGLGVLVGPVYGGFVYEAFDHRKQFAFYGIIILVVIVLGGGSPSTEGKPKSGMCNVLRDPLMLIAYGGIVMGNLGVATLEPTLPAMMAAQWGATPSQQGSTFIFISGTYLVVTHLTGYLTKKMGRWLTSIGGLLCASIAYVIYPFTDSYAALIAPNIICGIGVGIIDAGIVSLIAVLAKTRNISASYPTLFSLADAAFCIAFIIGPLISPFLVQLGGYNAVFFFLAVVTVLYTPLFLLLRVPERLGEQAEPLLGGEVTISDIASSEGVYHSHDARV